MISPATTDLWALRETSSFSPGPATASMALFTDSELPHVEKNAWSAPTASAISFSAPASTWLVMVRSSSPFITMMSEANTSRPTAASTRGSTPRPCLWPGGRNDRWPRSL
jgi:hypothetical protein